MPPPPKFASFTEQKSAHSPLGFNVTLMFCLNPPIFNVRGCPFTKIWFNIIVGLPYMNLNCFARY